MGFIIYVGQISVGFFVLPAISLALALPTYIVTACLPLASLKLYVRDR